MCILIKRNKKQRQTIGGCENIKTVVLESPEEVCGKTAGGRRDRNKMVD